jgi:hypothetical protein
VLVGILISIGQSTPQPQTDEHLAIQRERNEILREQLHVQQMQAEMQYMALKQREKDEDPVSPAQVESSEIPRLQRGETYRYTKEPRPHQMDNFSDDPEFQKRQSEQDTRIERLKRWKNIE